MNAKALATAPPNIIAILAILYIYFLGQYFLIDQISHGNLTDGNYCDQFSRVLQIEFLN